MEPLALMESMNLGKKIQILLEHRGVKQAELARRAGTYPPRINEWIQGRGAPSIKVGLEIAKALGVSLDYLADDSIDEPPAPELSEDERRLLEIARTLQGGAQAALWRIVNFPGATPPEGMPSTPTFHAMPIADRNLTASSNQRAAEKNRPVKRIEKPEEVKKPK